MSSRSKSHLLILIVLALGCLKPVPLAARAAADQPPAAAITFKSPPAENKMTAWWFWYGPAVTKQEVRRELTAMRDAGLGGVTIYPAYPQQVDDPALGIRNLRFLSPEYLEVYRYAIQTAKSLGMTVDVTGGSGWPFGGPSVSVDEASHALRVERRKLQPGSPVGVVTLKPGEHLLATFARGANGWTSIETKPDGTPTAALSSLDPQSAEVMSVISTPVGMKVKRPAWGGEGYVIDHLSAPAFEHYADSVLHKLVDDVPPGDLRAIFADSLEAYGSDWTAALPGVFRHKRGYDLEPYYPLLFDPTGPRAADVRFDYWETVADLFVDGFIHPLHTWAQAHGVKSEVQAYGVPAVPQRSYADVDLPGGEQYDWRNFTEGRWASSAAHFYGKKRVVAEYATWAGMPNRFTDTLDDLKLIADLQFLTGMTELAAATLPYSPPAVGTPGWQYYAGPAFSLNQSWWPFFPDLAAYVQRASYVLEQGKPGSAVLLYLPVEDVEANAPMESLHTVFGVRDHLAQTKEGFPEFGLKNALHYQTPLVSTILSAGYTFDGISGDILVAQAQARGNELEVGDGSYAVVVLPRLTGMRLSALERIADFVRGGGAVIAVGRLPERSYGGTQPEQDSAGVRDLIGQMFGIATSSYSEHNFGAGHAFFCTSEATLPRALRRAAAPDLQLDSRDAEIGFIHRRAETSGAGSADYYFVANTGTSPKQLRASFPITHRNPQLWELETGQTKDPGVYTFQGERTVLNLSLGPRRSMVVYFGNSGDTSVVSQTNLPTATRVGGEIEGQVFAAGNYYAQAAAGRQERDVPPLPPVLALSGPWDLQFASPLNFSATLPALKSWTEDSRTRYFSGMGEYSTQVNIPGSYFGQEAHLWLDLGDVRYAARVRINGQLAGDLWQPPFRIDVTPWIHIGSNALKIQVANLLINSVLGDKPPDYSQLNAVYGERFPYPEDWKANPAPWPAGLLGPVRLVPAAMVKFKLEGGASQAR